MTDIKYKLLVEVSRYQLLEFRFPLVSLLPRKEERAKEAKRKRKRGSDQVRNRPTCRGRREHNWECFKKCVNMNSSSVLHCVPYLFIFLLFIPPSLLYSFSDTASAPPPSPSVEPTPDCTPHRLLPALSARRWRHARHTERSSRIRPF